MNDEIKEILEGIASGKYDSGVIYDIDIKALLDYITNLQEENKILHKDFAELSDKYFFTKSRIDKAIDYIEKNKQIAMFADLRKGGTHQYTIECDADDLLNILTGE